MNLSVNIHETSGQYIGYLNLSDGLITTPIYATVNNDIEDVIADLAEYTINFKRTMFVTA